MGATGALINVVHGLSASGASFGGLFCEIDLREAVPTEAKLKSGKLLTPAGIAQHAADLETHTHFNIVYPF